MVVSIVMPTVGEEGWVRSRDREPINFSTHPFLLFLPFRIHTLLATGTPLNSMIVHLLVIIATFHLWTDPLGSTVFTSTY
jgi:hypothetical protein